MWLHYKNGEYRVAIHPGSLATWRLAFEKQHYANAIWYSSPKCHLRSIKSFRYPAVTEWCTWHDAGWHSNICPPSGERHQTVPLAAPLAAFVTHRLLFSVLSKSLQSRSASSLCFLHSHYLIPPLIRTVFQGLWWFWSRLAATMPVTLTASSPCSCARSRRWCASTSAPSRLIQAWRRPAQVHSKINRGKSSIKSVGRGQWVFSSCNLLYKTFLIGWLSAKQY